MRDRRGGGRQLRREDGRGRLPRGSLGRLRARRGCDLATRGYQRLRISCNGRSTVLASVSGHALALVALQELDVALDMVIAAFVFADLSDNVIAVSGVQSVEQDGYLLDMFRDVGDGWEGDAPELPLTGRGRCRGVIASALPLPLDALSLAAQFVAQQQQEELLQCVGVQTGRVIGLAALDEPVVAEELRGAGKGGGVDSVDEQRLEE
jgi:hypothetical protein